MPHNGHLIAKFEEKRFMCLRLLWKIDFSNGSNILTECTFFGGFFFKILQINVLRDMHMQLWFLFKAHRDKKKSPL